MVEKNDILLQKKSISINQSSICGFQGGNASVSREEKIHLHTEDLKSLKIENPTI